jgi:hypothetical protein
VSIMKLTWFHEQTMYHHSMIACSVRFNCIYLQLACLPALVFHHPCIMARPARNLAGGRLCVAALLSNLGCWSVSLTTEISNPKQTPHLLIDCINVRALRDTGENMEEVCAVLERSTCIHNFTCLLAQPHTIAALGASCVAC